MATDNAGPVPAGEPVAIVGMACRFPGAENLDAFWRLLEAGESGVIEGVPGSGVGRIGELFPNADVQSVACRFGAYVDGIDQFDAGFFRISPFEAQLLDPQQRMMLETSWQALEDAGIDAEGLAGSRTGVYAGISNYDYRWLIMNSTDTAEPMTSLYSVSGTSFNTAIGRVAYVLGLHGPAMAVDTACSSSLVAVHQAVAGLQLGEADLALAGGVHAIVSGRLTELRGNAGMLAPDGQCKTFDAAANGYVRGEGCGIVVLKRLSEAEADGDRIWGVIAGSAINQDGATPGLTVPSGEAQERVVEDALARAGVQASDVDYVETHGTGTPVGDPIEAQAVGTAYSRGRDPADPLLIGSVKTNIGHLEAAAGIAGLIKATLAVERGVIPRHLNFRNPNPAVAWEQLPLRVTTETTPWPATDRPPLAGVSAFGWSGTNAHMLVRGHGARDGKRVERSWTPGPAHPVPVSLPEPAPNVAVEARATRLLPLSGKSDEALAELAGRYLGWLDERSGELGNADTADQILSDMAWTAGVGRSHFPHRAGVAFRDAASLREALTALSEAATGPGPGTAPKVAFAYTGGSSQWVGMGKALYDREPVARAVLDRCDAVFREERGCSLLDVMFGRSDTADLDDAEWMQPAIYALGCALTALWESVGVRPAVVVGHSLGEIAAAHTAGVYSLEDGMRFTARRSLLMSELPEKGAMAAVFAPADRVAAMVEEQNATSPRLGVNVAADNGVQQAISGPEEDVQALLERFGSEGLWARQLQKSIAYHSVLVEPALDDLEAIFADLDVAPPSIDLISSTTGRLVEPTTRPDGAYWRRHAREPVAFRESINTLAEEGVDVVVELGARAVLGMMVAMNWPGAKEPAILASQLDSAEAEKAGDSGFVEAVAGAYEAGLAISFEGLYAGEERRRISLPTYPFQRERHWVEAPRRRRLASGHPLLGVRHESPRGEIQFEAELSASEPAWLEDHRVYGRLVAPGGLYGALAAAAAQAEDPGSVAVENMQLHSPLLFPEDDPEAEDGEDARKVQVVLDGSARARSRRFEVFSKGDGEDGWTLHAEARVSSGGREQIPERVDLDALRSGLPAQDPATFYRARAEAGIDFGPRFRTIEALWCDAGEALGEIALQEVADASGLLLHPVLLDGVFQVMGAARNLSGAEEGATYLPFGWDRLWLASQLPERLICHARVREPAARSSGPPEVIVGDVALYSPEGLEVGGLSGFAVKRATRSALRAATAGLDDLLYEVVWRDQAPAPGIPSADFLEGPEAVADRSAGFADYLAAEGVEPAERAALLDDLERLSRAYALRALEQRGWTRAAGARVEPAALRTDLQVAPEHERLFGRLLRMLAEAGVLTETAGDGFAVAVGADDALPDEALRDPDAFAEQLGARHPHGSNELGLLRRCGDALAEVLQGREDPLALLFSGDEPGAADLYLTAPAPRAANRMLGDAVAEAIAALPEDRRLRVLEVGAGTGSATAAVLPVLPEGRFDYTFTDISAGFFSDAEARFEESGAPIEYRALDIERNPAAQGFDAHGYDLVIAANVLHATRDLGETLAHCGELLAPSGQLVALEGLRGRGWQDLTFGLLEGWWRFDDAYRPSHALADPDIWRRALADSGFGEVAILGAAGVGDEGPLGSSVIVAAGPAETTSPRGIWILAADEGGVAAELASALAARNQTVLLAGEEAEAGDAPLDAPGVVTVPVDERQRESWRSLIERLPADTPLRGVAHLRALDGHGAAATTAELAEDATATGASALALLQGLADAGATPTSGVWFVTRGAQVLDRERDGELAGATLWGIGKALAREAPHLQPRMVDLDPDGAASAAELAAELLFPDREAHIAYRAGERRVARLVRGGSGTARLALPDEPGWRLARDEDGALDRLQVEQVPQTTLETGEVRVAVEAVGLNYHDVLLALGVLDIDTLLGREVCGRVLEVAPDVTSVSVGDRVMALGFGMFAPEAVTKAELVAPAPPGLPVAALATVPSAFTTAALAFEIADLAEGERVLIHAGTGGVGLAAIQLAQAAGAEVFATASAPKQAYLRSLGVEHVFDSRQTAFGEQILEATGGAGVHVVLNSLTGEGFIEASLSCLGSGGRFVEIGRRGIWSEEAMAAARPDVAYSTLAVDQLKEQDPARPGAALRAVAERVASGELTPLVHTTWPLTEAGAAMELMRSARHIGKIVLTMPPLARGALREDRTYLVTGGLGGIGSVLAERLADLGAGAIVLNGRRAPDPEAQETIEALRERGVGVHVELADVTDAEAVSEMLARIDEALPPLGGVFHSVGVLSDGALENQSWERFEAVLWPKLLGAWQLHRATLDRDLDLFVVFSSLTGVLGNSGQTNHAAANAFLDQFVAHRRALGLRGQAIAWGAWAGLGEAEEHRERIEQQLAAAGTGWITPQQGIAAIERQVRHDVAASMVATVDWQRFAEHFDRREPLLEELLSATEDDAAETPSPTADLVSRLRGAPEADREQLLVSFLQQELRSVMRLQDAPAPSVVFSDLGMDSLMAVEFRNRLNLALAGEHAISSTAIYDYPDLAALAGHLARELGEADEPATLRERAPQPRASVPQAEDGIAIVGMACRFPGGEDLAAFWRELEAGENAVTDGRRDSGSWEGVAGDPDGADAAYRRGAYLKDIDRFDSLFFRIAPIEARMMDPQQRMLLETTWQALEDAGIDPDRLRGSRTGVYAGVGASEYRQVIADSGREDNFFGTSGSVAVGRIAFTLGLEGPAVPFDLACASAMVAVHQGVIALQRGEADLALAGSVNAVLSPSLTHFLAEQGMLSTSGQCWSFDEAADGFVRGEGCGVVVLKRLSDAEADGDRIWAVIRGSAVNQNGAGLGLILPNGPAQERVMQDALAQAGVDPAEVDYMEAHGPGTPIGDAVELHAVANVYGKGRDADRPLLVGSVKTNIGHLEHASAIAGLIKTVLAMQRGTIPKHLNLRNPNPDIDWERMPVRVTTEATEWPRTPGRPPLAGVNTFGISGSNAHLVLEGYAASDGDGEPAWPAGAALPVAASANGSVEDAPDEASFATRSTRLLPLSAKAKEALPELAAGYLAWLDEHAGELASGDSAADPLLSDMAWTAGVGRSHFPHRAGLTFHDAASLRAALGALAAAEARPGPREATNAAFVYRGRIAGWAGIARALHEREPVARAVLDRCDEVLREARGRSLLDALYGRTGAEAELDEPAWAGPGSYALECALTALWASAGVLPSAVLGHGAGEIAAAQAAGMITLEDGLRVAAAADDAGAALAETSIASPSLPFVSGATGRPAGPDGAIDAAHWRQGAGATAALSGCAEALAELGTQVIVEIGPQTSAGADLATAWPDSAGEAPEIIASLHGPSGGAAGAGSESGFVEAVAGAYEAGLAVSLGGLFAGERRRRISLPGYPFQRVRYWVPPLNTQS